MIKTDAEEAAEIAKLALDAILDATPTKGRPGANKDRGRRLRDLRPFPDQGDSRPAAGEAIFDHTARTASR